MGVEPTSSRSKGGHAAAASRWRRAGCGAGIRTRIFRSVRSEFVRSSSITIASRSLGPVNSRTCCRCYHPTSARPVRLAGRRGFAVSTLCGAERRGTADHAERDRPPRLAGSEPAVLPLDDLPMVGSGGVEPPCTCARGRWATDYPTTRETLGAHDKARNGVRAGLEPDLEGHNLPCWPLHYPHSRTW